MKGQILRFVEVTHNFLRKRIHKRNKGFTVLTKSFSNPISKWKAITVPEKMIFFSRKALFFFISVAPELFELLNEISYVFQELKKSI